jgi:hypothetical protein
MASLRRRKTQQAPAVDPPPLAGGSPVHDDQLDADDMSSIGMFLLSRRESGATIGDAEDLFPAYSMHDVYGIHSGISPPPTPPPPPPPPLPPPPPPPPSRLTEHLHCRISRPLYCVGARCSQPAFSQSLEHRLH